MSFSALTFGNENTSALAATRSSRQCSTSGRPFECQRTVSLDRRDDFFAINLATAARKAHRGRYLRAERSHPLVGRAVSWQAWLMY